MINNIIIEGFKCFKNSIDFPISMLNLLTGINGRGKSSLLQSLLIVRQSLEEQEVFKKVLFNGSCVNLGTYDDVKNSASNIFLNFKTDTNDITLNLHRDEKDDMIGVPLNFPDNTILEEFRKIHYIAADRVGPQEFYLKSTLPEFINVGTKGEYVANVLFQKRDNIVHESLFIKEKEGDILIGNQGLSPELIIQTGAWLSKILDTKDVKVYVEKEGSSRVITLSFSFGGSKRLRPTNIGFGYTYILPIVLSGLIAKKGEMLIVENPEAHLHPKAQSNLIKFLALVASSGVQVFIESHSEHILNAIRILVKEQNDIKKNDISILFFSNKTDSLFYKIEVDDEGGIDIWPPDFFDQNKIDNKHLLGF